MPIQTNRLSELIIIKELTISATTYGETINVYKPVKYIYASILNQKGDTRFKMGNVYEDTISFFCRYQKIQKKGIRIEYNCQDYDVINITTVQRNQNTIIDCIAVQ